MSEEFVQHCSHLKDPTVNPYLSEVEVWGGG